MEQADHPGRTWARRGDTLLVQQSMPEDILTAYAREAQVLVRAAERSANPARPVQGEAPNSPSKPPLVGQKRDPENGLPVGQPPQQRNWPSDDPFDTWSSRGFRARQATGRRPGSEAAVMPESAPDSLRSRDDYPRAADGPALLKTGASALRSSKERARLRSRRLESPFAQALFAAAGGKANSHSCALSPHDRPPRPTRSLDTRRNSDGQRQKLAAQAAWESLRRDEEFARQVAAAASGRATGDPEQDKVRGMQAHQHATDDETWLWIGRRLNLIQVHFITYFTVRLANAILLTILWAICQYRVYRNSILSRDECRYEYLYSYCKICANPPGAGIPSADSYVKFRCKF